MTLITPLRENWCAAPAKQLSQLNVDALPGERALEFDKIKQFPPIKAKRCAKKEVGEGCNLCE